MRINPMLYGILVVSVFLGIIFGFQSAGIWSTSGKVSASGEAILPLAEDVNTIKGWMTLAQISTVYGVSVDEILSEFKLSDDTLPTTAIKDLESDEFSVTDLRNWLQNRSTPVEILPTVTVTLTPVSEVSVDTTPTAPLPTHLIPEMTITGRTTFQEVMDWGVSQEAIEQIIGIDLPAPAIIIKDFTVSQNLEFSSIKTLLQSELDQLK